MLLGPSTTQAPLRACETIRCSGKFQPIKGIIRTNCTLIIERWATHIGHPGHGWISISRYLQSSRLFLRFQAQFISSHQVVDQCKP